MHLFHGIAAVALWAALMILVPSFGTAEQSPHLITSRQIPAEYKATAEFLEYLKPATEGPRPGFNVGAAPKWDLARLMSFVAADGIAASDVNRGGKVVKYSVQQISNAVTARKGIPFQMLSHLGYIYAQPYKHYSELRFVPEASGVVVHVAEWYRLAFAQQGGQLKLTRLDYLMREGH
jgi:hypothetical protein